MESWRIAQIVADREVSDDSSRGSGYLVAAGLVLTAAHVVAGASAVRVRLDVDQRTEIDVRAESWWADPLAHHGTDLAVIMIPADATAGRDVDITRFGRIRDCAAVLAVQAFGFPRFKLRARPAGEGDQEVFRDLEQVTGHMPAAANRRQGTLALYLDDPPPASPEPEDFSPWEGMSGAAVWIADRIIGVVAEHHSSEGAGRLTTRRVDRIYGELLQLDLDQLVNWLGLPPAIAQLADVVPAEPGELLRSAYLQQVREIAPDVLIGRDSELVQWAEFCAGPDTYAWWQAGPWAGKSALASWFVTHPPAGVDIISFFITGRLSGQADSDAFLDAMIEQLSALDPAGGESPPVAAVRVGEWLRLLEAAGAWAEERARRLVVVVDGLDEDEAGATSAWGRPSIASLLPRRPPPGARFIVTSRPDPGLPDDVPSGHPLRTCIPFHLPVSWVAEDLGRRAKLELQNLLTGDQVAIDVVGCIAASGGGLTRSDLSALTGAPPFKLDPVLRGMFGRSLEARVPSDYRDAEADPGTRVHLFAHETLRVTAEEQLGGELARYRQGIHDWICSYASQGWPVTTPGYAIRGYLRLLIATSDAKRLSALARDSRRHAFLVRATGISNAALIEIGDVQRLIAAQDVPDLQALVEMAVYRHALSIRNQSIPIGLPAAWGRLAYFDHAEALAHTITDPDDQAQALTQLVTAAVQAGDPDRAEALARTNTDPEIQAVMLTQLATVAVQAGDSDRASRLAADAEALARSSTSFYTRTQVLAELATAAARASDSDRAEALARTITDPMAQAQALIELATATAQAGDPDRAEALAVDAETAGRILTEPRSPAQRQALTRLATALTQSGDPYRGEALARIVVRPNDQAQVLAGLATVAAQAGDRDRASRLATDAEPLGQALAEVATATAQSGDPDRGEALARTITSPYTLAQALAGLAAAAARSSDPDRGEALARTITSPLHQAQALTEVATVAAQAGDLDRASRLAADAEALARTITDPYTQAEVLAGLATVAAQAGDRDRASRLATDAEALACTLPNPYTLAQALAGLAAAAAQAGDLDRASRLAADAEAVARTITDPDTQAFALVGLATAPAQAGDPDHGEALARTTTDPEAQIRALAGLVTVAAQVGDSDRASRLAADAEALARAITDPSVQARALTELAAAVAQAGDLDRARQLVALALAVGAPEIRWWIGVVSRFFPSVIRDAGEVFINAYKATS